MHHETSEFPNYGKAPNSFFHPLSEAYILREPTQVLRSILLAVALLKGALPEPGLAISCGPGAGRDTASTLSSPAMHVNRCSLRKHRGSEGLGGALEGSEYGT